MAGGGIRWSLRPLPTQPILWFYDISQVLDSTGQWLESKLPASPKCPTSVLLVKLHGKKNLEHPARLKCTSGTQTNLSLLKCCCPYSNEISICNKPTTKYLSIINTADSSPLWMKRARQTLPTCCQHHRAKQLLSLNRSPFSIKKVQFLLMFFDQE